ncbi:hypothetical protein [Ferrovibrio sp.]|uniref:hypothetical protein n=1 Tax=Ferrovibrio sp. TaxID=1917215 RepID=UPI00311D61C0
MRAHSIQAIPRPPRLVHSFYLTASLCLPAIGAVPLNAQEISIRVISTDNIGVESKILLKKSTTEEVLIAATNKNGEVRKKMACELGYALYAVPKDQGTYLNSEPEVCSNELILFLQKRQTPQGNAQSYKQKKIILIQDGAPAEYLYFSSVVFDTKLIPSSVALPSWSGKQTKSDRCDTVFFPIVYTEIFKKEAGGKLAPLNSFSYNAKTDFDTDAKDFAGWTPQKYSFNLNCASETVRDNEKKYKDEAADSVLPYLETIYQIPPEDLTKVKFKAAFTKQPGHRPDFPPTSNFR